MAWLPGQQIQEILVFPSRPSRLYDSRGGGTSEPDDCPRPGALLRPSQAHRIVRPGDRHLRPIEMIKPHDLSGTRI